MMDDMTRTNTRNSMYSSRVVTDFLACEPQPQHSPHDAGPKQQQSKPRHILILFLTQY